jgi:hypothetical protein
MPSAPQTGQLRVYVTRIQSAPAAKAATTRDAIAALWMLGTSFVLTMACLLATVSRNSRDLFSIADWLETRNELDAESCQTG